jgi:hypothetical protein
MRSLKWAAAVAVLTAALGGQLACAAGADAQSASAATAVQELVNATHPGAASIARAERVAAGTSSHVYLLYLEGSLVGPLLVDGQTHTCAVIGLFSFWGDCSAEASGFSGELYLFGNLPSLIFEDLPPGSGRVAYSGEVLLFDGEATPSVHGEIDKLF